MPCLERVHAAQAMANPGLCRCATNGKPRTLPKGQIVQEAATTRALKHTPYFAPACNPPASSRRAAHLQRRRQRCCAALAAALHGGAARGALLRNRNDRRLIAGRFVLDLDAVYHLARARDLHPRVLRQVGLRGFCYSDLSKHPAAVCRRKGAAFHPCCQLYNMHKLQTAQ